MTKKFPSNRKSNFVRLHITHKEKQKDSNMNTYSIEEVYRYLDLDILHINNKIFIKHKIKCFTAPLNFKQNVHHMFLEILLSSLLLLDQFDLFASIQFLAHHLLFHSLM